MNLNSQTTPSQSTPPILSSSATDPESPSMVLGENGLVVEANSDDWSYDPNEPRYCICNQVSYGDMVACDNEAVSIQFHFYTFFVERKKLKKKSFSLLLLFFFFFFIQTVSIRMVSLSMCGYNTTTKRQMVLPEMYSINETKGYP